MYVKNPIPVTVRSKVWVCGRSLAGIAGSNPAEDTDICLLWVLFVVQVYCSATGRSLIKSVIRCNSNPEHLQSELAEEVLIRKKIYFKIFISLDLPQLYSLYITSHTIQKSLAQDFKLHRNLGNG